MILETGSRVLIVHRRLFDGDGPRYFVGVVDGYEPGLVRVTGYSWTRDPFGGTFVRKSDIRTKVVSLVSGTVLVYQLSTEATAEQLTLYFDAEGCPFLVDGHRLRMDLAESSGRHVAPRPAVRGG